MKGSAGTIWLYRSLAQWVTAVLKPLHRGKVQSHCDKMLILRWILKHLFQSQQPTTACFADFHTAFNSVYRTALWSMVLLNSILQKFIQLISLSARLPELGFEFKVKRIPTRVRRRCSLSPVLFNSAIDCIRNKALEGYSGRRSYICGYCRKPLLMFWV